MTASGLVPPELEWHREQGLWEAQRCGRGEGDEGQGWTLPRWNGAASDPKLSGEMQNLGKWLSSLCPSPGDKKQQGVESRRSVRSLLTQTILGSHDHPTPFNEHLPSTAPLRQKGQILLLRALKLLERGRNAGKELLRALQTLYFSSCKEHTWL